MLLGIDHLVIACADPDAAARELEERIGLRAGDGGQHDVLGTFNRLVWLGDTYLELIGLFDRSLAEQSWVGAPTARALDGGGGLATWAVASDAIATDVDRLRTGGSTLGDVRSGERVRPDGRVVRWTLAVPPTLDRGDPPFLIEHDPAGAEWSPSDRAQRATQVHPLGGPVRIETLEIAVDDPGAVGLRVLRTVGVGPFRPSLAGHGARDAAIGRQTIRYRRGAEPALDPVTIHLVVSSVPLRPREVEAIGCRFTIRGE